MNLFLNKPKMDQEVQCHELDQSTDNHPQPSHRVQSSINDIGEVLAPNAFASVDLNELNQKQQRIEQLESEIE